ncbi:uncharacterized protein LOC121862621 [Homarus americanus]|uniref:uncharacterized protein LOC121862621 n=1 Tax=Homarus americanus TaxID=6706 RepID=UPI001C473D8B|nr:uncharacterized protein LOC121862621 [Homarus americanus]
MEFNPGLLQQNSLALFVLCGAHNLNLILADAAKGSLDATCYFGYLTKVFTLFSVSPQRWQVLIKHVSISLKSWSDVRWERRVKNVEAIRYQPAQIREALLKLRECATDPVIKVEIQSLAEEVGSYRFVICSIVWYDILSKIQHVSKLKQSITMQLGVAVDLLKKTRDHIVSYRNTGFADALTTAKEICEAMNVDTVLKQKRLKTKKCHFSYKCADEPVSDALKRMDTTFFNVVMDTAISSLNERFKTLGEVNGKFKVLLGFTDMSDKDIVDHCQTLNNTLTHEGHSDIDGRELAMELQSVPDLPSKRRQQWIFSPSCMKRNLLKYSRTCG